MEILVIATLISLLVFIMGFTIYMGMEEWLFDYTKCQETKELRARSSGPWVQMLKVGSTTTPIIHPARHWTEVQYICDGGERWRTVK